MGACRSRQERPCDGCVSGSVGNLQLRRHRRRHDQGSHWLSSKPIRAECCSNKLFIIIPDGEEAAQSRGGPINGRAAARRPPNAGTGRSSLPRWSNTVPLSFRATPGSRPPTPTTSPPDPHDLSPLPRMEKAHASLSAAVIIPRTAPVDALYERSRETRLYAESRLKGKLDRPAAGGGGGATDSA